MKKLLIAAMVLCMGLALVACGENPLTGYKSGDVTLGQYKGVAFTPLSTMVTEADIQAKISALIASNPKVQDVAGKIVVEDGDTITLSYVGTIDGVPFETGTADNAELTIGSGQYISGFESGLIGHSIGETVVLDLVFPDNYGDTKLAGKPVEFTCEILRIIERVDPEFTDEFVASVTDYNTIDEYRVGIGESMTAEREQEAESKKRYDLVRTIIENTTFNKDLSEQIYKDKEKLLAQNDATYSTYYGVDGATFFQAIYGMNAAAYDSYVESTAKMNIKYSYLLCAIADAENIKVTDEELDAYAIEAAEKYGYESVDQMYSEMKELYGKDGRTIVAEQLKLDKAADIIMDNAIAE